MGPVPGFGFWGLRIVGTSVAERRMLKHLLVLRDDVSTA